MTPDRLHEILTKYAESQGIQLNKDKEFVLEILQGYGGLLVSIGFEADPVHLQILGDFIKHFGNFPIFHGIDTPGPTCQVD